MRSRNCIVHTTSSHPGSLHEHRMAPVTAPLFAPMLGVLRVLTVVTVLAVLTMGTVAADTIGVDGEGAVGAVKATNETGVDEAMGADERIRRLRVPNTTVTLELVPVAIPLAPTNDTPPASHPPVDEPPGSNSPGDDSGETKSDAEAAAASTRTLWFLRTEVTWDLYDVFVYRLDQPQQLRSDDAEGRPSKPYVPPDRGFGHHGFPAMGMTFDAAQAFCVWLSEATGERFRLPTEAEWMVAARAGAEGDYSCGPDPSCLRDVAWFADNALGQTRAVATRRANAFGLHDMHGNVAEWVVTGERRPIAKGGSYRDDAEGLAISSRMRQTGAWNASDPQFPKSEWWLADCSWVGFRVVMEAPE